MDIGIGKPITLSDFVKRVFRSWPGYQLAIKHQLGGSSTNEIHEWLCQVTTEYVEKTPQLDRDTLAEWLDQIFDNEFGLVLDDNSTDVFSNVILRGAKLLRQGPAEEMKKQWDALKEEEEGGQISKAAGEEESSSESDGEDDGGNDNEDEPMEEDKPAKQPKPSRFVEGDDGWTQILYAIVTLTQLSDILYINIIETIHFS
uniref:Pre-rRNA-processing protein TSR2 homolog n=1 Tax=Panagrolaimus sp. ES5 TaxID=591445 RepID=A0AC34GVE3_9BILA